MIAVIDYGAGNVGSVVNALVHIGVRHVVTDDPTTILAADGVIFPGVGATADAMAQLRSRGLVEVIHRATGSGKPFFGVCVGQQVLFGTSFEGEPHPCLGVFGGDVRRFPDGELHVPHMGWNTVRLRRDHPLFAGIPEETAFYFVHSYYVVPEDEALVLGETDYGVTFPAAVAHGSVVATQFHPEKSGRWGLQVYRNFAQIVERHVAGMLLTDVVNEAVAASGRGA
jgi:imidazole glycerol-phosphate synthase subunit HisH